MDERGRQLLRDSWRMVEPLAPQTSARFYARLFAAAPHTRALFAWDMGPQRRKLMEMIGTVVVGTDDPAAFTPGLEELGRRHREYGTATADYEPVGECLVSAMSDTLGERFTPEMAAVWHEALHELSQAMIRGAATR